MPSTDGSRSRSKLMDEVKRLVKRGIDMFEYWLDELPEPLPSILGIILFFFTVACIIDYVPKFMIYGVLLYLFVKYPKNSLSMMAAIVQIGLFLYISAWLAMEVNPYLGLIVFLGPAIWQIIKWFK